MASVSSGLQFSQETLNQMQEENKDGASLQSQHIGHCVEERSCISRLNHGINLLSKGKPQPLNMKRLAFIVLEFKLHHGHPPRQRADQYHMISVPYEMRSRREKNH